MQRAPWYTMWWFIGWEESPQPSFERQTTDGFASGPSPIWVRSGEGLLDTRQRSWCSTRALVSQFWAHPAQRLLFRVMTYWLGSVEHTAVVPPLAAEAIATEHLIRPDRRKAPAHG